MAESKSTQLRRLRALVKQRREGLTHESVEVRKIVAQRNTGFKAARLERGKEAIKFFTSMSKRDLLLCLLLSKELTPPTSATEESMKRFLHLREQFDEKFPRVKDDSNVWYVANELREEYDKILSDIADLQLQVVVSEDIDISRMLTRINAVIG